MQQAAALIICTCISRQRPGSSLLSTTLLARASCSIQRLCYETTSSASSAPMLPRSGPPLHPPRAPVGTAEQPPLSSTKTTSTRQHSGPYGPHALRRRGPQLQHQQSHAAQQLRPQMQPSTAGAAAQQQQQQAPAAPAPAAHPKQQQQQRHPSSPYDALIRRRQRLTSSLTPSARPANSSNSSSSRGGPAAAAPPSQHQQQQQPAPLQRGGLSGPPMRRRPFLPNQGPTPPQWGPTSSSARLPAQQQRQQPPLQQQRQQQQRQQLGRNAYGAGSGQAFVAAASTLPPLEQEGSAGSSAEHFDSTTSSSQAVQGVPELPTPSASPLQSDALQQPEQQQQTPPPPPMWHVFEGGGSSSYQHARQQQQQQQHPRLPPELQTRPDNAGPAVVDITHLLNLQLAADEEEEEQPQQQSSRSSDSWSAGRTQRWRKLSLEQKQLRVLESIHGQQQQLLWVTVHQPPPPPQGGDSTSSSRGPAAVWVKPWAADLSPEQLRCREGPSGQVSVLLELGSRPDLDQQPAAITQGLQFSSTAAALGDAADGGSDSNSSSGCVLRDWLLLSSGDFSPLEHENMFPNALVDCGDGRQLHSARGAQDVAAFVAEADSWRVQQHCENLIRLAWSRDNARGLPWVYDKLQQRWGLAALQRLNVGQDFLRQCLYAAVAPAAGGVQKQQQAAVAGAGLVPAAAPSSSLAVSVLL